MEKAQNDRLQEIIDHLNYNGPIFYRLDYAMMAEEKGFPRKASDLLGRIIQYAIQTAAAIHNTDCPLHTDHLQTLAEGTCHCLAEGVKWTVSYFLSKIAYQTLQQDYGVYKSFPIFIRGLKQRLAYEETQGTEEAIKIVTEALSLLEPFYDEMILLHAFDQAHGLTPTT